MAPSAGPNASFSASTSAARSCASVFSPSRSSFCCVFGPIPGNRPGGSPAKRSSASARDSTTSPPGLPSSLVIFASSRFSEIPTEQPRPVSALISAAIRRIVALGEKRPVSSR